MQRGETPERWIRKAGRVALEAGRPRAARERRRATRGRCRRDGAALQAARRRRVGGGRRPAQLRATAPHHRHRRDHLLLEPVLARDVAGHHRAARVVGEHPGRQRRVDRRARQAGRAHRAQAGRPGCAVLLSRLLQHGHLRHDLGQARTAEGVARDAAGHGALRRRASGDEDHLPHADEAAARAGVRGGAARPRAHGETAAGRAQSGVRRAARTARPGHRRPGSSRCGRSTSYGRSPRGSRTSTC